MKQLKLWTRTNEYTEVLVDGELRRFDIEYHGKTPIIIIDGTWYVVSRIQQVPYKGVYIRGGLYKAPSMQVYLNKKLKKKRWNLR